MIIGCFHKNFTHFGTMEDLSMENGLITKGARLLIPSKLRKKVLEQIHDGHLGIEKCMLKARDSVFWYSINLVGSSILSSCLFDYLERYKNVYCNILHNKTNIESNAFMHQQLEDSMHKKT